MSAAEFSAAELNGAAELHSAAEGSAFAAVDLGASSGRVMLGRVSGGTITLEEVARFANRPVQLVGSLHWNITALYQGVVDGLRTLVQRLDGEPLISIGIDTWAVDYGLVGADGSLLGIPFHYRDARTNVDREDLFLRNGIASLPFNTVYQLSAESSSRLDAAAQLLMIPDLLAYWLTGVAAGEVTNASTTGLLDPVSRQWNQDLLAERGLKAELFPELLSPGETIGRLTRAVASDIGVRVLGSEARGLEGPAAASGSSDPASAIVAVGTQDAVGTPDAAGVPVVAVGTHDTASAIVAVPAQGSRFAYIASGTWSLVGMEVADPVVTDAAHDGGFTNEAGVDGTVRLLRNVMGMWLVQESMRQWDLEGVKLDLIELLTEAEELVDLNAVFDPDLPVFLPPGDMPARIVAECSRLGGVVPSTPAEILRSIMDSLAAAYARSVATVSELSGVEVETVHIVGGGSQNALLCQLTADATGLTVVAGPVEGSALGNVLVQARAAGVLEGGLADLRAVVRASFPLEHYRPRRVSLQAGG